MISTKQTMRGKSIEDFHAITNVVIAAKASKEIPKTALVWALKHVVQPGDCITLVVVVSPRKPGKRLWGFPRFSGDCTNNHKKQQSSATLGQKCDITDSCSQMILQLHDVYGSDKINVRIKIVAGAPCGAVADEAKQIGAKWVVLDKHLKHEEKRCMEELQCNIVSMKRSQPKVLRLSLGESRQLSCQNSDLDASSRNASNNTEGHQNSTGAPIVMPTSSSEVGTPFTCTDGGISSGTSSDTGNSPIFIFKTIGSLKKEHQVRTKEIQNLDVMSSDSDSENLSLSRATLQPCSNKILGIGKTSSKELEDVIKGLNKKARISTACSLLEQSPKLDRETGIDLLNSKSYLSFSGNFREVILPSSNTPAGSPPLCSICQQKAPIFGKPPTRFTFSELELATDGFSQSNFLAEGGFGSVHRGVLPDGQAIAVKQHKLASTQGDQEFFSEMEVLSCAQHRNVVMLIGYCVEDGRRLLVYEYICNGSLDSHLYDCDREPLEWSARQKIAVGAARGLRYLHEECRIGCIVHRDMRPNNILITHDFEPSVGDFGLARWQPDGDLGEETRVLGTFGYLAPEYAQSGLITEKADVYSFGVVLLELVTGRRAIDINRPRKQQCLIEWARPLLARYVIDELVDPRLGNQYCEQEVHCMLHAVSLCISHDSHTRPRISQVLRMLEGNIVIGPNYVSTPGYCNGNRHTQIRHDSQWHRQQKIPVLKESSGVFGGKRSYRP